MGTTILVQVALVNHPTNALNLDCGDAVVASLKDNFSRVHKISSMVYEAHEEMIVPGKKVFPAGMNLATHGTRPTHINVTHAWLHGIQLVIGAHVWLDDPKRLKP